MTIQTTMRTTTTFELRRRERRRRGGERVRGISRHLGGSHFRVKKIFHFIQRVILKYIHFFITTKEVSTCTSSTRWRRWRRSNTRKWSREVLWLKSDDRGLFVVVVLLARWVAARCGAVFAELFYFFVFVHRRRPRCSRY